MFPKKRSTSRHLTCPSVANLNPRTQKLGWQRQPGFFTPALKNDPPHFASGIFDFAPVPWSLSDSRWTQV